MQTQTTMLTNQLIREKAQESIDSGVYDPEGVAEKLERHARQIRDLHGVPRPDDSND
ncbi:hypothetical protein SAMN04487948_1022 [Halogranum amylolyticum]|uniref:Uncharacterized protein n=1 Tax=Halogranum amylolyticum TaxID=660520 RepID=A0A1H8P078_9EURY|nr:hypothetical protein SAMN04487948_1022 [Halogranum amylolyticum]